LRRRPGLDGAEFSGDSRSLFGSLVRVNLVRVNLAIGFLDGVVFFGFAIGGLDFLAA